MSFAAETAYKIALIAVILAVVTGFLAVVLPVINNVVGTVPAAIPTQVATYLGMGRQLVNNFIPADLFNICVTLWLTAYPLGFAAWLSSIIIKLMKPE